MACTYFVHMSAKRTVVNLRFKTIFSTNRQPILQFTDFVIYRFCNLPILQFIDFVIFRQMAIPPGLCQPLEKHGFPTTNQQPWVIFSLPGQRAAAPGNCRFRAKQPDFELLQLLLCKSGSACDLAPMCVDLSPNPRKHARLYINLYSLHRPTPSCIQLLFF